MAVNKFDNSMLDAGTIGTTANKLLQLDGSAKIPAIDGSLLTGIPSSFTKSASDPTISTNPSGGVGTIWANTTSGEVYCCTDATAGANIWTNVGAGSGDIQAQFYGERGVWGGGESNASPATINTIDYVTIGTAGNATDFGDLTEARNGLSACGGGGGRGVFFGGNNPTVPAAASDTKNIIDYITVATTGNATDFGDLTVARKYTGSCSSGSRGLLGPGTGTSSPVSNTIDYVSLATTGNAIDFGDATSARYMTGSCGNATRGVFAGGGSPSSNVMDYVTIASVGNAIDFGDMLVAKSGPAGLSSETRGVFAGGGGGGAQDVIQYITIASVGNATDFGNLLSAQEGKGGCSNGVRGVYGGGYPPVYNNVVEYITIASTGNSVDFGDLTAARTHAGSCSQ